MSDKPASLSSTFEVNEVTYQCRRLDVFQQLELVSKLTPVLSVLSKDKKAAKNFPGLFAAFVSALKEDELREVLRLSLFSVSRKGDTGWTPIYQKGRIMFADIDLKPMLEIVYHVLEANSLSDFFSSNSLISEDTENTETE